jgi:hypothetical protein
MCRLRPRKYADGRGYLLQIFRSFRVHLSMGGNGLLQM